MTYSPYGDRDSGGTRTDVDNEVHEDQVHEDQEQEDRAYDGDVNGHDVNGHDGAATPFQRESTDTEARADDAAATEKDAGTADDAGGHVPTDEAAATDETMPAGEVAATGVDAPEHADGTVERDTATEDAMAGGDPAVEDQARGVDDHDGPDAMTDADGERVYADGEPVDGTYGDEADVRETDMPASALADDADLTATHGGADSYIDGNDRAADRTLAGGPADATSTPYGDPVAGGPDADYVAVGVAEPMTESEAEDVAATDRAGATEDVGDDMVPLTAAAAADGSAVGMMPGDAPVVAAAQPLPNAEASHDRWQQIQLGFIDDPRGSVESARSLVVEAVEARISALRDRQNALDGWQSEATPDTEVLRAAIQGYRDMLNSLNDAP